MAPFLSLRDPESSAGAVAPANSSFPQQGSFDWILTGRSVAEVAWGYLSRLSKANVDVETVFYCRYLGQSMTWSSEGRKRFDDAFTALQHAKAFSNSSLWFGFGIHHPSEILTDTDTGSLWAALCACLVECYGPSFVPAVFLEMTILYKQAAGESDRGPSLQKWRSVTEICAGILAHSNFGELAEELMQLDGQESVAGGVRPARLGRPAWCRGVSSPKQVAQALIGLSELTQGKYQQITLCGRADACVIAAIAHFVFDIPFKVVANDTQESLRPCEDSRQPKLIVLLERGKALGASENLEWTERVYLLKNETPFVQTRFGEENTICSSRVPWKKALTKAFSKSFRQLMEGCRLSFGTAIGSAARIFQAIAEADEKVPEKWLLWCRTYSPKSFGKDYAHFAVYRFPELEDLSEFIDEASRVLSFEEAARKYEGCLETIADVCVCSVCKVNQIEPKHTYCLRALTETIIRTIRCLAGMIVDIQPTRCGLEKMYYEQVRRARDYDSRPVNPSRKGRGWGAGWGPRRIEARIIEHIYSQFPEPTLLAIAERIFSGGLIRDPTSDPSNLNPSLTEKDHVSAIRSNGICYYLQAYHGPAQHAAFASTVRVLPGEINWQGRPYPRISDGALHSAGAWQDTRGSSKGSEPQTLVEEKVLKQMEESIYADLQLEVTESLEANTASLHAEWGVMVNHNERSRLGIARTATSILRNSGQAACSRIGCKSSEHIRHKLSDTLRDISGQAYWAVDIGTTKVYITRDNLPIRFVAAHGTFNPIIQGTECLSCCILAGMRRGLDKFAVIRPDPSFDMEPGVISQLENSSLRRLRQDASVSVDALPLLAQSSEVEEIEETGKDVDNGSQSASDSCNSGGSFNQDNSTGQGYESSPEGDSYKDERREQS